MAWLLVVAALCLLVAAWRLRRQIGLPWRRVVYSDTGARRADRPLIARRYGLVGKPDYLIEHGKRLIPVEVKPGRRASAPYPSDVMQLAAYCLLVEETTGARPPYGLLRYAEATFEIRFDERLRNDVIALLDEMRTADPVTAAARSHGEPRRCAGCGFRTQCDEALA